MFAMQIVAEDGTWKTMRLGLAKTSNPHSHRGLEFLYEGTLCVYETRKAARKASKVISWGRNRHRIKELKVADA